VGPTTASHAVLGRSHHELWSISNLDTTGCAEIAHNGILLFGASTLLAKAPGHRGRRWAGPFRPLARLKT